MSAALITTSIASCVVFALAVIVAGVQVGRDARHQKGRKERE